MRCKLVFLLLSSLFLQMQTKNRMLCSKCWNDGRAHNTRSVSRTTDISRTEFTNSAQPNGSASDHSTRHLVRPVQSYLEDPRDCRNLRIGTLPEYSSLTPANRRLTRKYRQQPIQPSGIWRWSRKCTPSAPTRLGIWSTYRRTDVLSLANGSTD